MSTTEQKALALQLADEQETLLLEVANGERKPGKLPLEPFVRGAAELRRLSAENEALRARESGLIKALADCRDVFPMPDPGAELELIWGQAMGDPESVPGYVKAQVDALRAQVEALASNQLSASAWGRLYDKASILMAVLGRDGSVSTDAAEVDLLMHALHDLDRGEWMPGLMPNGLAIPHYSLTRPAVPEEPAKHDPRKLQLQGLVLALARCAFVRPVTESMMYQLERLIAFCFDNGEEDFARKLVLLQRGVLNPRRRSVLVPSGDSSPSPLTRPAVPEGWKLVPVEPTEDMIEAAESDRAYYGSRFGNAYRAMLAAAPQPEADDLEIKNASLESEVFHLSTLCDEQRQLLADVEKEFGTDAHGIEFEDGDSKLIDRVRAHLAMVSAPQPPGEVRPIGHVESALPNAGGFHVRLAVGVDAPKVGSPVFLRPTGGM